MMLMFQPGDRVRFPGSADSEHGSDLGTVTFRDGKDRGDLPVVWDRREAGGIMFDVDEIDPETGRITTILPEEDEPLVVELVHRHTSKVRARRRADLADERFWRSVRWSELAERGEDWTKPVRGPDGRFRSLL